MQLRPFLAKDGGLRRETWGWEVLADLDPQPEDWYVAKTRLSAFYGTDLEVVLRGLQAETVLMTGVLTNQCVAATSKDAMFRDFKPIVIEECTGTTHAAPARARDRDDARRLGRGARPRLRAERDQAAGAGARGGGVR